AGFRAVSDDDFARVVIAQQFAHAPSWDPSGTSWLPFPFWLYGGVMAVAGTSLTMARATAFVAGLAATALLFAAGKVMFGRDRPAFAGAALATVLPWSARLGLATVPELPTAALTVFGVATFAQRRHRILGALALAVACLSRYEPWPWSRRSS
ncbi:MAG: glycosyltransferase family 39 protein, partial [Myxococcota bacterium]